MRVLISVAVAVLTAASVQAQTPKEIELKKLREQIAALQERIDKYSLPPDYWKASVQAAKEKKPLVMFVGIGSMRQIKGAVVGQQDYGAIFDEQPPAIVVALPDGNGWINWRETLPANATDAQIRAAFQPKAVSQPAAPFTPVAGSSAERDADLPDEVSSAFSGMVRYRTTRVAQVSGNRSGGGSNSVVSRLSIPSKWQQPGGLEGLAGWSNKLYRLPNNPVRTWLGHVNPNDRWADGRVVANWGGLSEVTYQREYGEGAKFADVLSTAAGVFEVRIAEKINGEWHRSVPYRDAKAEPVGYKRVSLQQCAECHNQAGNGQYGTARIIGGDGVLSEPLAGLE